MIGIGGIFAGPQLAIIHRMMGGSEPRTDVTQADGYRVAPGPPHYRVETVPPSYIVGDGQPQYRVIE